VFAIENYFIPIQYLWGKTRSLPIEWGFKHAPEMLEKAENSCFGQTL